MYRQGDLLFIEANSLGENAKKKKDLVVLASSITGHSHAITAGVVYENRPERWGDTANFYVVIPAGGADLVHEEHKTIPLPEGIYKVIRQREVNGYVKD